MQNIQFIVVEKVFAMAMSFEIWKSSISIEMERLCLVECMTENFETKQNREHSTISLPFIIIESMICGIDPRHQAPGIQLKIEIKHFLK